MKSDLAKPVFFFAVVIIFFSLFHANVIAQELSKEDQKRLASAQKRSAISATKFLKVVRLDGDYPFVLSARPVVEDVWEATIQLHVTMKPAWNKLPAIKRKKAAVSLFKLWSSYCSMQTPPSYPWIKILDSKHRVSNPFIGYKNRMLDGSISEETVEEYEQRLSSPSFHGKP